MRNTPTVWNAAFQSVLFWDGRADSAWSQALGRFDQLDRSWGMELSVKDREPPGQVVTLEAQAPGKNKLVAPSTEADLRAALNDVGDDLRRLLTKARDHTTPKGNRATRDTIRSP